MKKQICLFLAILFAFAANAQQKNLDSTLLAKKNELWAKGVNVMWTSDARHGGPPQVAMINSNGTPTKYQTLEIFWIENGEIYTQEITEYNTSYIHTTELASARKINSSDFTKYIQVHINEVEKEKIPYFGCVENGIHSMIDCDDCEGVSLRFYIKDKIFYKYTTKLQLQEFKDEDELADSDTPQPPKKGCRNINYDSNQKTLLKQLIDWRP